MAKGITKGDSQYSGCWMYKDIFDQTARIEAEENDLSKEYCYLHVLKHLGFTYSHTDESLERYNQIWVYKDAPIGVASDDTWFNSLYDIKNKCTLGKKGMGYTKDNLKAFCSMNRKNGYTIDYRELFNATKGFDSQVVCLKYDLQKDAERTFNSGNRLQRSLVISKTMSDKHTKDIYSSKELFELAAAVMNVGFAMYSLNKFWFPSFSGSQCGDWNIQSKFNAVVKNFIKEYRK